jgi:hypothetical protein
MFWVNMLRPYGQINKLRTCPEALTIGGNTATTSWQGGASGNDPQTGQPYYGSYAINGYVEDPGSGNNIYGYASEGYSGTIDSSFFWTFPYTRSASDVPAFGDAVDYDGWPHAQDVPPASSTAPMTGGSLMTRFCVNRHNMAINIAYLDSHADHVVLKNLWATKWNPLWGGVYEIQQNPLPTIPKQ